MPVVAAPAAVIGVTAALWYFATLLFGLGSTAIGALTSGVLLGLALFLLLSAVGQAALAPVFPPPWRRSLFLGTVYAIAYWFAAVPAFGMTAAWLIAIAGGLATVLGSRRTIVEKSVKRLYHWVIAILLVGVAGEAIIAYVINERPMVPIGVLGGILLGAITPTRGFAQLTSRAVDPLTLIKLRPAPTRNLTSFMGYQAEALALATFLAPVDIPRSLLIQAILEVEPGSAPTLRTLAPTALAEAAGDSLTIDPLVQRFAFQRLAIGERRDWASRAVRMLASKFPSDYAANLAWCERLTPHALAAATHARELKVERGATALLLNQVAGYLALTGRAIDAHRALEQALECATIAFGAGSAETATVRENLVEVGRQLDDPRQSPAAKQIPPRALEERHLMVGGLALTVVLVAVVAGVVLWRQASVAAPRPSGHSLTTIADLAELCQERPRYFPDAAGYSGAGPHPVQVFARHAEDQGFAREQLVDPIRPVPGYWLPAEATVHSVQLVACAAWRFSGGEIKVCRYGDGTDIPLHQATYGLTLLEPRTGRTVVERSLTVADGLCPTELVPPASGRPWRLYALPDFELYDRAIRPYVEELRDNGPG